MTVFEIALGIFLFLFIIIPDIIVLNKTRKNKWESKKMLDEAIKIRQETQLKLRCFYSPISLEGDLNPLYFDLSEQNKKDVNKS